MMQIQFKRPDGTYVALVNGLPYHVVQSDPLFAAADAAGKSAPLEPTPDPEPDEPPILSKMQWNFFLDITGFRAVADAAVKAMPKNTLEEKTVWAGMNAAINSSDYYRQGMALRLVERVRAMKLGVPLPTDDEVKAAWALAATFSLATLEG